MSEFTGSYIEIILDIARTDKHCAMSFLPANIQSAREELISLRAENENAKDLLKRSIGLNEIADARLEILQAEVERLTVFYETVLRIGRFQAFDGEIDLRDKDIKRLTAERDRYKAALEKIDKRTKYYFNYVTGATTEMMLTEIRQVGNIAFKAIRESESK